MRHIMLSAHFDTAKTPQRIAFFERVQAALPKDMAFVGFNLSGEAKASFDIVVGYDAKPESTRDAADRLRNRITALLETRASSIFDHAIGEITALGGNVNRQIMGFVAKIDRFVSTLDHYKPEHCFLWNQFNAFHCFAEAYLRQRGIGVSFFHDGVLPGSIALDFDAEMGGSWVSARPELLTSVPVGDDHLAAARQFLQWANTQNLSRHEQVEKILVRESLDLAGFAGKKVIFYAGQNDWHAGIQPDGKRRMLHSPLYTSSTAPLADLDDLAVRNDWAVVFKPHPLDRDKYVFLRADEYRRTLILVSTDVAACIAAADVVVTIASQTAYVAAMAGKPVVMLGKNQLTGKGLTYDVNHASELEEKLRLAMEDPLARTREIDLARHAAQLERAYLFDFGLYDNEFLGRGPRDAARLIAYAVGRPPEETIAAILRLARGEPIDPPPAEPIAAAPLASAPEAAESDSAETATDTTASVGTDAASTEAEPATDMPPAAEPDASAPSDAIVPAEVTEREVTKSNESS